VARILELIQIVMLRRRTRRRELAERFEVSERMIQKDLDVVRHGLKLELRRDADGYYFGQLPHLPTTEYSFPEALALLEAARAAQVIPGVNSAELAAAIARLEVLFPEPFRPLLREAAERLPHRAVKAHRQEMLVLLHRALAERRQVRICYATASRAGEAGVRVVEPYAILPYGRSWYLVAYDHRREKVLDFKIDRVLEAELLDAPYEIPADFDINAHLGDAWGLMGGAAGAAERVALLFEPEAGRWVSEECWHPSQQNETLPDGRVRVAFQVGVTPEMVSWLLYYGSRVEVVEPAWLRARVKEEHAKAAAPAI